MKRNQIFRYIEVSLRIYYMGYILCFFPKNRHSDQGFQTPKCRNPGGFGAQRSTGAGWGHL